MAELTRCYKKTSNACDKDIYQTKEVFRVQDPSKLFMLMPIWECLKPIKEPGTIEYEKEFLLNLNELYDTFGFNALLIESSSVYKFYNIFEKSKWFSSDKGSDKPRKINLVLDFGCSSDSASNFKKFFEDYPNLRPIAINIDEPVENFKGNYYSCVDPGYAREIIDLAHNRNIPVWASGYYINALWGKIPAEVAKSLGHLWGFSELVIDDWQFPYLTDVLHVDGLLYSRYIKNLIPDILTAPFNYAIKFLRKPSGVLPVDDWFRMLLANRNKTNHLGAWIQINCQGDHYDWGAPCMHRYFDTLISGAIASGMDSIAIYPYGLLNELRRQFESFLQSMIAVYSGGTIDDDDVSTTQVNAMMDAIRNRYFSDHHLRDIISNAVERRFGDLELEIRDFLTKGAFEDITTLLTNQNLLYFSEGKDWRAILTPPPKPQDKPVYYNRNFRSICCSVYKRRLIELRGAALRCNLLKAEYEPTSKIIKTLYCQRSSDGSTEVDCDKCIEWGDEPLRDCTRNYPKGELDKGNRIRTDTSLAELAIHSELSDTPNEESEQPGIPASTFFMKGDIRAEYMHSKVIYLGG